VSKQVTLQSTKKKSWKGGKLDPQKKQEDEKKSSLPNGKQWVAWRCKLETREKKLEGGGES